MPPDTAPPHPWTHRWPYRAFGDNDWKTPIMVEDDKGIVTHLGPAWHVSGPQHRRTACIVLLIEAAICTFISEEDAAYLSGVPVGRLRNARQASLMLEADEVIDILTASAKFSGTRHDMEVIDIAAAVHQMDLAVVECAREQSSQADAYNTYAKQRAATAAALNTARDAACALFRAARVRRPWGGFNVPTCTMGPPIQWGSGLEAVGATGRPWGDFDLDYALKASQFRGRPADATVIAAALGPDWMSDDDRVGRAMLAVVLQTAVQILGSDDKAADAAVLVKPGTQAGLSAASVRRFRRLESKVPFLVVHRLVLAAARACRRHPVDPGFLLEHLVETTRAWVQTHGKEGAPMDAQRLLKHLNRIARAAFCFGLLLDKRGEWEPPA